MDQDVWLVTDQEECNLGTLRHLCSDAQPISGAIKDVLSKVAIFLQRNPSEDYAVLTLELR